MIMSQSTHPLSPRVASMVAKKTIEERTELINSVFSMLLKHNLQPPNTGLTRMFSHWCDPDKCG